MDINGQVIGFGFSSGAILTIKVNINVKYIGYTQTIDNLRHFIICCLMLSKFEVSI